MRRSQPNGVAGPVSVGGHERAVCAQRRGTARETHLRLERAIELVRDGQSGLAEIGARTGFADQGHLSRWDRRVRSVPLTWLVA
jgi:AraC-like DNA-binding protein